MLQNGYKTGTKSNNGSKSWQDFEKWIIDVSVHVKQGQIFDIIIWTLRFLPWDFISVYFLEERLVDSYPSRRYLIQSHQWKHENNVSNLLKVKNKDISTTSLLWTSEHQLR